MAAGKLDRRIAVQRLSEGALNAFNEPTETWAEFVSVWASKNDISDGEKTTAGQEYSALMSRFKVRSNPDTVTITTSDRISYEGVWDIKGVKDANEGRKRFIEITARKRSD